MKWDVFLKQAKEKRQENIKKCTHIRAHELNNSLK